MLGLEKTAEIEAAEKTADAANVAANESEEDATLEPAETTTRDKEEEQPPNNKPGVEKQDEKAVEAADEAAKAVEKPAGKAASRKDQMAVNLQETFEEKKKKKKERSTRDTGEKRKRKVGKSDKSESDSPHELVWKENFLGELKSGSSPMQIHASAINLQRRIKEFLITVNEDDKMNMSLLFFSLTNSMRQYYTIHHSMSHNATDMPAKISSIQTNDDVLDAVKNLCDDCQKWDKVHAATCEEFTEEQQKALKQMVQMIVICSKEIEELALYIHMRALGMMSSKRRKKKA